MIRSMALTLTLITSPAFAETLTTARVVRPNMVIAPADIIIAETRVQGALTAEANIIGLEAKVTLYPGRPIMPAHVGPAALIERNQPITLIFRQGGLTISAEARALSRGAIGENVRVMNMSSRTTVLGIVRADGSVEVSSEGIMK